MSDLVVSARERQVVFLKRQSLWFLHKDRRGSYRGITLCHGGGLPSPEICRVRQHAGDPGQLLFQLQSDGRKIHPNSQNVSPCALFPRPSISLSTTLGSNQLYSMLLLYRNIYTDTAKRIHDQVQGTLQASHSLQLNITTDTAPCWGGHWV